MGFLAPPALVLPRTPGKHSISIMGQDLYLEEFYLEEFHPRRFKGTQIDLKFFNLGCRAPAGQMAGSRARPPEIF